MGPKVYKLLLSFFKKGSKKSFPKDEIILDSKDKKVFFLTTGVVRMFNPENKKNITLNIYKEGSVFPIFSIFDLKNKYSYESVTDVEGYFSGVLDFKKFLDKNPSVLSDLLRRIYLGLSGFYKIYESLLLGDAYPRVLTALVIHARRFAKSENGILTFDWNLTHRQLASQTGLARESVTREIKKLQDKKLIEYRGRMLVIFDISKLENESFTARTS